MTIFHRIFDRRKSAVCIETDRRRISMKEADALLHSAIGNFEQTVVKINGRARELLNFEHDKDKV